MPVSLSAAHTHSTQNITHSGLLPFPVDSKVYVLYIIPQINVKNKFHSFFIIYITTLL